VRVDAADAPRLGGGERRGEAEGEEREEEAGFHAEQARWAGYGRKLSLSSGSTKLPTRVGSEIILLIFIFIPIVLLSSLYPETNEGWEVGMKMKMKMRRMASRTCPYCFEPAVWGPYASTSGGTRPATSVSR
jgi:hypothetical protein